MKQKFAVKGMTCSACSSHIEKSVNKLDGIEKVSVNLLTNSMQAEYDAAKVSPRQIAEAVEKAGYGVSFAEENEERDIQEVSSKEDVRGQAVKEAGQAARQMKIRLWISIGFLIPLMYVSMHHMFQKWFGIPVPGFLHGNENAVTFAFLQFLLLIPILYVNRNYFKVGLKALFRGSPNMDSLIAIGSGAAVLYGIYAIFGIGYGLGHGNRELVSYFANDIYLESAGTILALITVGKYLESRSKGKTSEAITKLMDMSPKTAIIVDTDDREREVPTEQVKEGDIFLVKPGSLIPVDGTVITGYSSIDESAITGESIPIEKREGDKVISATVNKAGYLKCRAEKVGTDTTLAQIIRLVEEASASKAPIAALADKIAGVFVPSVIAIALISTIAWLISGADLSFALSTGIAVLVISCPCALGLATPVTIMVGTGVGASNGILIKSGEALQEAKHIDTVVLDKTGTITEGNLKVTDIYGYRKDLTNQEIIGLAASLERQSEHPLAEAIVEEAQQQGQSFCSVTDFQAVFGKGIEGKIDNKCYFIGNQTYLEEKGIVLTKEQQETLNTLAEAGKTPLLFAGEKALIAVIGVMDRIKTTSLEAIHAFQKMHIDVIMLTGDNKKTAATVSRHLDITEVIAEVRPQEKAQKIRELKEQGKKTAMIGDGINDAPALVSAHVGIAIGAGTDVAMESADIVLMRSNLQDAVTAIQLSKAVIRNIKQNLFWAFFYNSIGIPLAAGLFYPIWGLKLNPMFGAAAMSLSSICVVGNALRLKRFKSTFSK